MTEEEMFNRIFRQQNNVKSKQSYAQLECLECLKLTNKMLIDELNLLIEARQNRQGKSLNIYVIGDDRTRSANKNQAG